jgi:hypothetical protein
MPETEKAEKATPKSKVVLNESVNMRIDGRDYGPGDLVEVDKDAADKLIENGFGRREGDKSGDKVDEEQAKAEAEARDAAAEIEESKTRSIDQLNDDRITPAAVARRGPGRPRNDSK